jgi:hypothetical protein
MVRNPVVILGIDPELLFNAQFLYAAYLVSQATIVLKGTVYGKKCFAMPDVLLVNRIKITLGKRKVINSIEQIGFAGTVVAHKTIYLIGESHLLLPIIFKINDFQCVDMHNNLPIQIWVQILVDTKLLFKMLRQGISCYTLSGNPINNKANVR